MTSRQPRNLRGWPLWLACAFLSLAPSNGRSATLGNDINHTQGPNYLAQHLWPAGDPSRLFSPFDLAHPNDARYRLIAERLFALLERDQLLP